MEERLEMGLEGEEGLEEFGEEGDGEEMMVMGLRFGGGGREEREKVEGDEGMEVVEGLEVVVGGLVHGDDLVAAEAEESAAALVRVMAARGGGGGGGGVH